MTASSRAITREGRRASSLPARLILNELYRGGHNKQFARRTAPVVNGAGQSPRRCRHKEAAQQHQNTNDGNKGNNNSGRFLYRRLGNGDLKKTIHILADRRGWGAWGVVTVHGFANFPGPWGTG